MQQSNISKAHCDKKQNERGLGSKYWQKQTMLNISTKFFNEYLYYMNIEKPHINYQ